MKLFEDNGTGLSSLTWTVLDFEIEKNHTIQCSNWERMSLTRKQINYAATDAWISREIFYRIYETNHGNKNELEWCREFLDSKQILFLPKTPKISTPAREVSKKK